MNNFLGDYSNEVFLFCHAVGSAIFQIKNIKKDQQCLILKSKLRPECYIFI